MSLLYAQGTVQDIKGFRDHAWDTPFSEMSEGLVKTGSLIPGYKGYEKVADDMFFAGVKAQTILYLFKKDKFNCISFVYLNSQLDSLVTNLTATYGEAKITETAFVNNYEWNFPSAIMVLAYFHMNESEKSVALGIRKPKK